MNIKKVLNIAALSSVAALCVPVIQNVNVGTTLAYLTDIGETKLNKATIALDPSTKIVEYFPEFTTDNVKGGVYHFKKGVQVFNDGYVDAYVRVRIDFTSSSIKNKSKLSFDGKNFYSFSDFCTQVENNGWHYCSSDGYFYYKTPISSGNYEELEKSMTKDDETHIFNWNKESSLGTTSFNGVTMLTKPLFTYAECNFGSAAETRNFTIDVSQDSIASYLGNDYASAWKSILGYAVN